MLTVRLRWATMTPAPRPMRSPMPGGAGIAISCGTASEICRLWVPAAEVVVAAAGPGSTLANNSLIDTRSSSSSKGEATTGSQGRLDELGVSPSPYRCQYCCRLRMGGDPAATQRLGYRAHSSRCTTAVVQGSWGLNDWLRVSNHPCPGA